MHNRTKLLKTSLKSNAEILDYTDHYPFVSPLRPADDTLRLLLPTDAASAGTLVDAQPQSTQRRPTYNHLSNACTVKGDVSAFRPCDAR